MRRASAGQLAVFLDYMLTAFSLATLGLLAGLVYITWR